MLIRLVQDQDFEALSYLWNQVFPEDKHSAKELKFYKDSFKPPYKFAQQVVFESGRLIGSVSYEQNAGMYHPQKFFMRLFVHPEYRRQGVGQSLYETLLKALAVHDPISIRVQVNESDIDALQFAHNRGFEETKRDWQAVLELSSFRPERFTQRLAELKVQGFSFKSFAEFDDKLAIGKAFYELFSRVRQDVPRSEPATPFSWEFFKENVIDAPDFYPEASFFAIKGQNLVALSQLWKGSSSNDLYTGLTATSRQLRGKGVATALKIHSLSYAKQAGAEKVFTNNDTRNVEMLAINDKLGFKRLPASLSMLKRLRNVTQGETEQ